MTDWSATTARLAAVYLCGRETVAGAVDVCGIGDHLVSVYSCNYTCVDGVSVGRWGCHGGEQKL